MDNVIIQNQSTLSKCLSFLPFEKVNSILLDWGVKKLFTANLMRVCVAAQLEKWESYREIEAHIEARKDSHELFGVDTISGSQLSRRVNGLPTTLVEKLFFLAVQQLHQLTHQRKGLPTFGKLHIVDASCLHLGPTLGKWAYVTRDRNQVKFHTRLVVCSEQEAFPDKVIPSTGNVDEREVMMELVTDPGATYLFDRGYVDYAKMDCWMEQNIKFAIRINERHQATILEKLPTSDQSVLTDAKVVLGSKKMKHAVRLVEFKDDDGRFYRIATNRWDLKASEVAELYRCRWMIELFFKWLKQHLRVVKLQSTKPQGIWNQIYFAMTAYCLALIVKLHEKTPHSTWTVLGLIRANSYYKWEDFLSQLHKSPKKKSKGRQKSTSPPNPVDLNDGGGVAIIKPVGEKRSKTAKYTK